MKTNGTRELLKQCFGVPLCLVNRCTSYFNPNDAILYEYKKNKVKSILIIQKAQGPIGTWACVCS